MLLKGQRVASVEGAGEEARSTQKRKSLSFRTVKRLIFDEVENDIP